MRENEAIAELIRILNADEGFISLLSKFRDGAGDEHPMLVNDVLLPDEWPVTASTCMLYPVYNAPQLEYTYIRLVASCRAKSYYDSRYLGFALHEVLNRTSMEGFSVVTEVLQTLPPSDGKSDNYNTPVQILVRAN